mmetsp:Transcript_25421/g.60433  ORF Transcript_25421/g.60433 Transcript_25421/m.60433 type:complete len:275 (+) Transcript_25421:2251-3075(+)
MLDAAGCDCGAQARTITRRHGSTTRSQTSAEEICSKPRKNTRISKLSRCGQSPSSSAQSSHSNETTQCITASPCRWRWCVRQSSSRCRRRSWSARDASADSQLSRHSKCVVCAEMRPGMLQMLCSNSSCTSPRSSNTARIGAVRASPSKSAKHCSTKANAQSYRPLQVALVSAAIDASDMTASGGCGPAAEVCMYRSSSARADCSVCIDLQREACAAFDSLPYNTAMTAILRLILSEPCPGSDETSWWSASRSPASPRLARSRSSGRLYALSCA